MADPAQPHDALFKNVFSSPENAAALLRAVLPAPLLAELDLSSLELQGGSYIDASLASSHSDLLFAGTVAGERALFYVLFEHQSSVDELMPLRLLKYMVRIWERHAEERGGGKRALPLPVLVPVVVHHSEAGWSAATAFEELFDAGLVARAKLGSLLPRFRFVLDDWSHLTDDALQRRALGLKATLALWVLRDARTPGRLVTSLARWIGTLVELSGAESGREALLTIFRYLSLVAAEGDSKIIYTTLREQAPRAEDALMTTLAERWIAEGEARGEARGRAEAAVKTKVAAVLAVLEVRNLEVSAEQRARIESCTDLELLERWHRAAITASEARELFA